MTLAPHPAPRSLHRATDLDRSKWPFLAGLGCATGPLRWPQQELCAELAGQWGLCGQRLDRWNRIVAGSGIDHRSGVLHPRDVLPMTTAQRMAAYEQHAPGLAIGAARAALTAAGCAPAEITDLIVVSCTGFSAPGVDVELVKSLQMRCDVRRTMIGFMGCFGAINGLRAAIGACCMDPHARALVVCVELCSLHARNVPDPANMVATALFADGAAAAVVSAPRMAHRTSIDDPRVQLAPGRGCLLQQLESAMSWRVTDHGFAMTLARSLPQALMDVLPGLVKHALPEEKVATMLVHPGGPGILDAVDAALNLRGSRGLEFSRSVLRGHGNMSSGTVLFVLREALTQPCDLPAMLLAFGPGLSVETLLVLPEE